MIRLMLCLLALAGAAVADVPGGSPREVDRPPASIWRPAGDAAFEHLQSGLVCPVSLAGYPRVSTHVYDRFGLDVSCGYSTGRIAFTIYLTRRPGVALDQAFADAQQALLQHGAEHHPRLASEAASPAATVEGKRAIYTEDGGARTGLWMADLSGWQLEYRVTWQGVDDARIFRDLDLMHRQVTATAGARLGLCARVDPPKRDGVPVTDAHDLQQSAMITSLAGGAALATAQAGKAQPAPAVIWCAEAPVARSDKPFMFWRGLTADGRDAGSDQLTLVTVGVPPALLIAPDVIGNEVRASQGKGARWVATVAQGDRTLVFGYFDGRPSPSTTEDLFERIVSGMAHSVGSWSVKGKQIMLGLPATR